jgi:SpoVK/Ycf46/Vps4 family AAA+-type ATPase
MMASQFIDNRGFVFQYGITPKTDTEDFMNAWNTAASTTPSMLILEDIDAIKHSQVSRSAVLNLMDGIGSATGMFVVATTNFPEEVDPALIGRAGRFDRSIGIPLATRDLRYQYLAAKWKNKPYAQLLDMAVEYTEDLSLAALNSVHYEVAAYYVNNKEIYGPDRLHEFIEGLRRVEKSKEKADWGKNTAGIGFSAKEEDRLPHTSVARGM